VALLFDVVDCEIRKTARVLRTRLFGKPKSAKLYDFYAYSVSEILRKYSNSGGKTFPERESCKTAGISPVSLRLEAKGPKMM